MSDSGMLRKLLDEMANHEAKIIEIKGKLAVLLGVATPAVNGLSGPTQERLPDRPAPSKSLGPVAKGTKGRQVLEILFRLGGKGRARRISESFEGGEPTQKAVKRVRTYIHHLSREESGYLNKTDEPGVWKLTPRAYEVLGEEPIHEKPSQGFLMTPTPPVTMTWQAREDNTEGQS